jgi:hypothetical protein
MNLSKIGKALSETMAGKLEGRATRIINKAFRKDPSAASVQKIEAAIDGATAKMSDKIASNMVAEMFPPLWKRRPILTMLGGTLAGSAAYNMFSRQPGPVDGGNLTVSNAELGRMAADEQFAQELNQMQAAGMFDQQAAMGSTPMPNLRAAQSDIMLPQTRMQAATAGYGGRVATPSLAMEHGA